MRLLLGLERPDGGEAPISGKPYAAAGRRSARSARCSRPRRSTRAAPRATTCSPWRSRTRCPARVDEVTRPGRPARAAHAAGRRLLAGHGQRLGIAAALLGDPRVVLLDEPVNGLDPEGVLWIRNLMKRLAAEGRTVLVSPPDERDGRHRRTPAGDRRGKLIADCTTKEFIERNSEKSVLVRSPDAGTLADLIAAEGGKATPRDPAEGRTAALTVTGLDAPRIGEIAAANRIVLHELCPAARLAGGGVPRDDRRQRRVRRRHTRGAAGAGRQHDLPGEQPMTSVSPPPAATAPLTAVALPAPPPARRAGFGGLMLAEWDEDPFGPVHGVDAGHLRRGQPGAHRPADLADAERAEQRQAPCERGRHHHRPGQLHPRHRPGAGPARHLRAGRAGDHQRVLDRRDPLLAARRAAPLPGDPGQGPGLRGAGDRRRRDRRVRVVLHRCRAWWTGTS